MHRDGRYIQWHYGKPKIFRVTTHEEDETVVEVVEVAGDGMHRDVVARLNEWEWPQYKRKNKLRPVGG